MQYKTEYDSIAGVEIEICRPCNLLNKDVRAQSAYLRGYDDLFAYRGGSGYDEVRSLLTSAQTLSLRR